MTPVQDRYCVIKVLMNFTCYWYEIQYRSEVFQLFDLKLHIITQLYHCKITNNIYKQIKGIKQSVKSRILKNYFSSVMCVCVHRNYGNDWKFAKVMMSV